MEMLPYCAKKYCQMFTGCSYYEQLFLLQKIEYALCGPTGQVDFFGKIPNLLPISAVYSISIRRTLFSNVIHSFSVPETVTFARYNVEFIRP